MKPQPQTEGELLFREYLISQGHENQFVFEKPMPGKRRVVDYTLTVEGREYQFDVKDVADEILPPPSEDGGMAAYSFDPYTKIRKKIEEGREKFKEYKEFPCGLVLRNKGAFHVSLENVSIMLGAMYGDAGISIPLADASGKVQGTPKPIFLGRGKMIRPKMVKPQNTTISALIALRHVNVGQMKLDAYIAAHQEIEWTPEKILALDFASLGIDLDDRRLGVIIYENAVATIPFPRELFRGKFDLRYGVVNNSQEVVFRGEGLL